MTQISIFFLNFNFGEQWWFNTWNIDAAIDCWKNAFNARMADTDAECVNARCVETPDERIFCILIARRDLEKYAHHGSKQNIQHQKEKWCEALSLKSDRPYYVDFSVFDRSGKVSKSRNSEKFSKELWFMWVTPWNEACLKKQSYMISSGCMLRDFSKLPQSEVKNMISDFLNDADFNFFLEL